MSNGQVGGQASKFRNQKLAYKSENSLQKTTYIQHMGKAEFSPKKIANRRGPFKQWAM